MGSIITPGADRNFPPLGRPVSTSLANLQGLWRGDDIGRNLAKRGFLGDGTPTGTVGKNTARDAIGATFAASAHVSIDTTNFLLGTQRSFAMGVVVRRPSAQLYRFAIRAASGNTYDLTAGIGVQFSGAGFMVANIGLKNYDEYELTELVQLADNETASYISTWNADTLIMKLFKNGVLQGSLNYTSASNSPRSIPLSIGNDPASTASRNWNGEVMQAWFADGLLTDAAAAALGANAARLYAASPRRLWGVSPAGGTSYSVSLTETASAADAPASLAVRPAALTEAATASDAPAGLLIAPRSVTEAATAADSVSAGATSYSVSAAESAALSEVVASLAVRPASVSESATATDTAAGILIAVGAVSEAITATESASTGPQYAVTLTETASLTDAIQAVGQLLRSITEAATASDAVASAATMVALITEPASATDSAAAGGVSYSVGLAELVTALDLVASSLVGPGAPEVLAAISDLRRQLFGSRSSSRPTQRASARRPAQ